MNKPSQGGEIEEGSGQVNSKGGGQEVEELIATLEHKVRPG